MRSYTFSGKVGTPWMHAHTRQEQALLAAPLIVANPHDDGSYEQKVVVLLHDFSFKTPDQLLAGLTAGPAADAMAGHSGHGGMDMSSGSMAMDLNDIEYNAYLASDRTLADQEVAEVKRGGRVHIINGATANAFTIDFGDLEGESITVDGEDIVPFKGSRFPLNMGQRIDVWRTSPAEKRSFLILALRAGAPRRTGIIREPRGAEGGEGRRARRAEWAGAGSRTGADPADVFGNHRPRRRQFRPAGLRLPPPLPHGDRHDVDLRRPD